MNRTSNWGNEVRCRFCLVNKRVSILLNASAQMRTFRGVTYWDMLVKICGDKAVNEADAPQKICLQCSEDVKKCFSFIMSCENSEERIRDELNFKKVIKDEVKLINVADLMKAECKNEKIQCEDEVETLIIKVSSEQGDSSCGEMDVEDYSSDSSRACETCGIDFETESEYYRHIKSQHALLANLKDDNSKLELKIIPDGENAKKVELKIIHDDVNSEPNVKSESEEETESNSDVKKVVLDKRESEEKTEGGNSECEEEAIKVEMKSSESEEEMVKVVPVGDLRKRRHRKQPKNLRKCDYCDGTFYLYEYTEHLRETHADKSIGCTYCDKLYFHPGTLIGHVRKYHPGEKFQCTFCEFSADVHRIYFEHMRDAHKEIFHEKKCEFCEFTSYSALCVGTHMLKMHGDKTEFKCERCDRKFFSLKKKEAHEKTHDTGKERSICNVCGRSYKNKWDLQNHMDGHKEEKNIECDICHKKFNRVDHYTLHRRCHSEEKNYVCTDCGAAYRYNSSLLKHRSIVHEKARKYACPYCPKLFTSSEQLLTHKKRHIGIRNYKCPECGKAFVRSTELKQHSVVHTGERRHVCEICGKAFTQSHVLRSHMKTHKT